jgi:hypothetical protein
MYICFAIVILIEFYLSANSAKNGQPKKENFKHSSLGYTVQENLALYSI